MPLKLVLLKNKVETLKKIQKLIRRSYYVVIFFTYFSIVIYYKYYLQKI